MMKAERKKRQQKKGALHMEVTYRTERGVRIPNLTIPQQEEIFLGKYAHLRKAFLKEHRRAEYTTLKTTCRLTQHLAETEQNAKKMIEQLITKMAQEQKINEEMKEKNPEKYAHVVIGRWADVAEGAVFKKWGIVDEFPMWCKKVAIGQDFGYTNDPSASIRCGIIDNALYLDEVDYRTGLLSGDIIKTLRPWNLRVIADSADPRLIQEIHNGGIKIYAVEKGQGSVNAGIDKMQGMEIFITKRSYNLQREFRNYVWAKDKDGNYINEPEDHDNHGIDAARYYVLGELLGRIMKPKDVSGIFGH